jgi:hypothetical protein
MIQFLQHLMTSPPHICPIEASAVLAGISALVYKGKLILAYLTSFWR